VATGTGDSQASPEGAEDSSDGGEDERAGEDSGADLATTDRIEGEGAAEPVSEDVAASPSAQNLAGAGGDKDGVVAESVGESLVRLTSAMRIEGGAESAEEQRTPLAGATGRDQEEEEEEEERGEERRGAAAAAVGPLTLIEDISSLVPRNAIRDIGKLQQNIMSNLQTANKTVTDFNVFSEEKYASISPELAKLAKHLKSIKNDLDYIYKKTSTIRVKLKGKYPQAFAPAATETE